ncbi:phage antirepressor [Sneathia sanguinegens]|uniref:phage antirepressor n=1 Tax=Sneathia sanguinegens TaxID=40543 RepID=UPI002590AE99|nr:phage antirepressor [Sneathia sanguinegens]MDU4652905.1 phage antirepressor [Sneathia sanguinegens]
MNEIEIFKYEDKEVRTQIINNDIWFCLKDVCDILEIGHVTDTKNRLKKDGVGTTEVIDKLGRKQQATFINESNLYKVIFQSRKANAERFTEWVTSEVLPTIRKHGAYMTPEVIEKTLTNPDFIIGLATELKKAQTRNVFLENEVKILQPKAKYTDEVLNSPNVVAITQIAKDYGMSAVKMNKLLNDLGIQYKLRNQWLLVQKYSDKGYVKSKTQEYFDTNGNIHTAMTTYWTQRGRLFIYETLKQQNILPVIEREQSQQSLDA